MTEVGVAYDAQAREFLRRRLPQEHNLQETTTPSIVFISPEGELLDKLHGYAHPDTALAKLRALLALHPQYGKPGAGEAETDTPEERGRALFDLYELEEAQRVLTGVQSGEALYLRAQIARLQGDRTGLRRLAGELAGGPWALDVRVEAAYALWQERRFAELEKELASFPPDHPRGTEARYLVGLARYHQGQRHEAREHWKEMIENCSLSPWVYRADWAYYCTTFQMARVAEGKELREMDAFACYTPLNRHGYGYRTHPDLELGPMHAPFDLEGEGHTVGIPAQPPLPPTSDPK